MKKETIFLMGLAVIIVVLVGILFWPKQHSSQVKPVIVEEKVKPISGIVIDTPKENEAISSPLKITGSVSGNGWSGFESQVGTVILVDDSGKEISKLGFLMAKDWTQNPAYFEASLDFTAPLSGSGSLLFMNENPSGDADKDKTYTLPVQFK